MSIVSERKPPGIDAFVDPAEIRRKGGCEPDRCGRGRERR
jgi:hypothetical protein